jgi:putative transposase
MVNDNVMGLITQLSKYKAELRGKVYHEIGRFEKSSGICTSCNYHHKLSLSQRTFACHQCSAIQCRDWSAAISVANSGEAGLIAGGILARVKPNARQKAANQTKVFERSKLPAGSEKKVAA